MTKDDKLIRRMENLHKKATKGEWRHHGPIYAYIVKRKYPDAQVHGWMSGDPDLQLPDKEEEGNKDFICESHNEFENILRLMKAGREVQSYRRVMNVLKKASESGLCWCESYAKRDGSTGHTKECEAAEKLMEEK